MRLAKFLAGAGVASRRASEEIIRDGRVSVDGEVVEDPARDVDESHAVTVDGQPITGQRATQLVVYALNKPSGVVSTAKDPQRRPTVVALIGGPLRLYPVGRLDADTTGLILLTNDGDLAHRLTHPKFEVDKTYRAVVRNPPVRGVTLDMLRAGVELEDGKTAPARVVRVKPDTLEITIHEGRKRQVKRMCEQVGHRVVSLQRIRFGPLQLGELKLGSYRRLNEREISLLRSAGRGGASAGRGGASGGRGGASGGRGGASTARGPRAPRH